MKTYSELTHAQRKSAFNYHLNSLIDMTLDLGKGFEAYVISLAWKARCNATKALYCNDPEIAACPELANDPNIGILSVVPALVPVSVTIAIAPPIPALVPA